MFLSRFLESRFRGGLGFLLTPILTLVMPLNQAVGILLPILIFTDIFTLAAYWKKWETHRIWILLAGGVIGVALATYVLVNVSAELLKKGLAVLVLVFLIYRLFEKRILTSLTYQARPWHGLLAGALRWFRLRTGACRWPVDHNLFAATASGADSFHRDISPVLRRVELDQSALLLFRRAFQFSFSAAPGLADAAGAFGRLGGQTTGQARR